MKFKTGFCIITEKTGRVDFEAVLEAPDSHQISEAAKLLGGWVYSSDCRGEEFTEEDKEYKRKIDEIFDIVDLNGTEELVEFLQEKFNI